MSPRRSQDSSSHSAAGLTFLLSQLGAHVAGQFAERLAPLDLSPPHVGILRIVDRFDGLTQQALCEKLGMFPSRLVLVLDELEKKGLVQRRDHPGDRRSYALYLTKNGSEALRRIGRIVRDHQDALCAALDDKERAQLAALLVRIAGQQGLTPGVHPGLRQLGRGRASEA
jgi:DNA-binding MarR family transcriptional regulator